MISANGGLPAHRYTPQVTRRWPRGSEPALLDKWAWHQDPFHSRSLPVVAEIVGVSPFRPCLLIVCSQVCVWD